MADPVTVGAIILAAGRSKRFRSAVPKVLHEASGRPLALWVLETLRDLHRATKLSRDVLVVPPKRIVEDALDVSGFDFDVVFAVQKDPRGTGDATKIGLRKLLATDEVIVMAGDAPLVTADSLKSMVRKRRKSKADIVMLTAELDDAGSYGRVIRAPNKAVAAIVEAKDCTSDEREVREINVSTYVFSTPALKALLPKLRTNNAQGEYLLTDAVAKTVAAGHRVDAVTGNPDEALGANTRREYELVCAALRDRILGDLMSSGVTIVHPASTFVDAGAQVGKDTVLHPMTFVDSRTTIGAGCSIGPNAQLMDTHVGDATHMSFVVARGAKIGANCEVGPFTSIRAGTVLSDNTKAGSFVELKNAIVGEGSKVPHLSYMGDVEIGQRTNVGAGTITCNYDPFKKSPTGGAKHRTKLGDDVFIGSDTMLVAPVTVGDNARTGAGSVVNRDVADDQLVYGSPARIAEEHVKRKGRS